METFTTLLAEYFTAFNVCTLSKCQGHNWCHTTVWPENKVGDGGTSFRKLWTGCIQAALESEAAHLESTVSLLRGRDQQLYTDHITLLGGEQHTSLHRFHTLQRHDTWSWANAAYTMLNCTAQKDQSLLKVTLFIYRKYGKCTKPKLLKMAPLSSPCPPCPDYHVKYGPISSKHKHCHPLSMHAFSGRMSHFLSKGKLSSECLKCLHTNMKYLIYQGFSLSRWFKFQRRKIV